MRLPTLVPTLACVAAVPLAIAADPQLKFDGFVDSILSTESLINSDPEYRKSNTEFNYAAKLGLAATITEKIAAQVDLYAPGDGSIGVKQAYGTWSPMSGLEIKSGKFIGDVGWVAAYAPNLFRINAGPIVGLYTVDPTGVRVGYATEPISVGLTVSNGLFSEHDDQGQSDVSQPNEHFGYTLDIVFTLPNDKGSVNAEAAYDMRATGTEGDVLHLGLNATLTPAQSLTVGAEVIYQN
ncbi:MAG: outer membrane beta-barrel protein, partial [Planctomycetota bacterium]|nr:outer membrane beta-barrel protein [Planctomycetota bacterium]